MSTRKHIVITAALGAVGITIALSGCAGSGQNISELGAVAPAAAASTPAAAVEAAPEDAAEPAPTAAPAAAPAEAAAEAAAEAPAKAPASAEDPPPATVSVTVTAPAEDPPRAAAPERGGSEGRVATEIIAKAVPRMGSVVTDQEGWILYRFDKDTNKPPATNCYGTCAKLWPPVLAEEDPVVKGVSAETIGTVLRKDSKRQVTVNGWPVYHYIGDKKPGSWKGQAVGGTWFVVSPDGKKNLTCLPKGTPTAVPLPAEGAEAAETEVTQGAEAAETEAAETEATEAGVAEAEAAEAGAGY